MLYPAFKLADQVLVAVTGSTGPKEVFRITGINQASGHESYRYESTIGSNTRYFNENDVIAVVIDGSWHPINKSATKE